MVEKELNLYCLESKNTSIFDNHMNSNNCLSNDKCSCKLIDLNYSIWTMSQQNDIKGLKHYLSKYPMSIYKLDRYGYSALHYAAQNNHVDIVKLLLQKGIKVDYNKCGATPLHRSAYNGSYEACVLLINAGADINAIDTSFGDNKTPLMKAMANNKMKIVELLKSKGAKGDNIDSNEDSNKTENVTDNNDKLKNNDCLDTTANINLDLESVGMTCEKCKQICFVFNKLSNNTLICRQCFKKKKNHA